MAFNRPKPKPRRSTADIPGRPVLPEVKKPTPAEKKRMAAQEERLRATLRTQMEMFFSAPTKPNFSRLNESLAALVAMNPGQANAFRAHIKQEMEKKGINPAGLK